MSVGAEPYLLAVIPVCCALAMGRRPQATAFLMSVAVGLLYGILGCFLLDRPGFDLVGHTAAMGGVAAVWLAAVAIVAVQLARLGRVRRFVPRILARRPLRWLPEAGALLTVAVLIGFAIRPYVQTVRGHPDGAQYRFIASLQRLQGLPVDPTRSYAEQTLYWVIWYIGLPTVLLGGLGLALLVRRCLRALLTWRDPDGIWRAWALPLTMICAGSLLVLWAPDISPDQPWASQRLVVLVIPGLIIGAIWAASWLVRRARDRGARVRHGGSGRAVLRGGDARAHRVDDVRPRLQPWREVRRAEASRAGPGAVRDGRGGDLRGRQPVRADPRQCRVAHHGRADGGRIRPDDPRDVRSAGGLDGGPAGVGGRRRPRVDLRGRAPAAAARRLERLRCRPTAFRRCGCWT